jgi:hypothetical protein
MSDNVHCLRYVWYIRSLEVALLLSSGGLGMFIIIISLHKLALSIPQPKGLLFIPNVIHEHGEPQIMSTEENKWLVHQSSLAVLPAESSGSKQEADAVQDTASLHRHGYDVRWLWLKRPSSLFSASVSNAVFEFLWFLHLIWWFYTAQRCSWSEYCPYYSPPPHIMKFLPDAPRCPALPWHVSQLPDYWDSFSACCSWRFTNSDENPFSANAALKKCQYQNS